MTVEPFLVLVPGDEEKLPLPAKSIWGHSSRGFQTAHRTLFCLLKLVNQMFD